MNYERGPMLVWRTYSTPCIVGSARKGATYGGLFRSPLPRPRYSARSGCADRRTPSPCRIRCRSRDRAGESCVLAHTGPAACRTGVCAPAVLPSIDRWCCTRWPGSRGISPASYGRTASRYRSGRSTRRSLSRWQNAPVFCGARPAPSGR